MRRRGDRHPDCYEYYPHRCDRKCTGRLVFRITGVRHPIARGLALGTSAHAIGTAKALELGEIEGAMSSLSIAVAGLMTVIAVPIAANLI